MSATAETEVHLSAQEREALIARLREFGHQQEESQQLSDRGSLEVAADLMRLYEDKAWVDELPAPSRRSKVPPDDFGRFAKWATEDNRLGLERARVNRLKRAADLSAILVRARIDLAGASERALQPLGWMLSNGYEDRLPEVWRDAGQLAEGDVPGRASVRRALSDWKRRNVPKAEKSPHAPQAKGNRARVQRWQTETEHLLYELPHLAAPVLRDLLAKYEEHKQSIPPIEEW